MTTVAPGGRPRPARHHGATVALTDVVADALAMLDGAAVADPETETGSGADALPSDEQEFAAPPRDRS
jgi:hypothetical protein